RHGRWDHACVADHVGVGEVDHSESKPIGPFLSPRAYERRGGLAGAHLGLLVVGGHVARGGDQLAPLPRAGSLLATVEEVSDVRVLLGLRNVQLLCPAACDHLGERDLWALGSEYDRVRPALLVLGQRRQSTHGRGAAASVPAGELLRLLVVRRLEGAASLTFAGPLATEAGLGQGPDDLPHAVGAKVEAQHSVFRSDARLVANERRFDELVGLTSLVGIPDGSLAAGGAVRGMAVDEQVIGTLGALPAPVAIHGPVAAHDRSH